MPKAARLGPRLDVDYGILPIYFHTNLVVVVEGVLEYSMIMHCAWGLLGLGVVLR